MRFHPTLQEILKNGFKLTLVGILYSGVLIGLTSCGDDDEELSIDEETLGKSASEYFDEAQALMDSAKYQQSVKKFEDLQRLYPFSPIANKAQVMVAYANYKDEEYDKAISAADNFLGLNPGSKDQEFMYYLKAVSYYDRIQDVKRDQEVTEKAKEVLTEIITRFPESKYARDAKFKLDLIYDHLGGKEMEVGRYYLKQKKYVAAINRFKYVVEKFDETAQVEEALYRLVETNLAMGLDTEAVKFGAILGHNYPTSEWYGKSYELLQEAGADNIKVDIENGFASSTFSQPANQKIVTPEAMEGGYEGYGDTVTELQPLDSDSGENIDQILNQEVQDALPNDEAGEEKSGGAVPTVPKVIPAPPAPQEILPVGSLPVGATYVEVPADEAARNEAIEKGAATGKLPKSMEKKEAE